MTDIEIIGFSNLFTSLIISLVSWPMSKGMVPPNKLYGAKFTLSFKSKEHWYAINEYTGKRMQYWCIPIFLSGIIALLLPNIFSEKALAFYAIFPLCILIPAFQGWRFAKHFDAEWERKQPF